MGQLVGRETGMSEKEGTVILEFISVFTVLGARRNTTLDALSK